MKETLLNFTKKTTVDLRPFVSKPALLVHPFDRSMSRIDYKPDLMRFSQKLPTLKEDLKGAKSLSWDDCCDQRALDLLKMNRSRYIVSYSGGIDSTALLVALMRTWSEEDQKKIVISMSHDSIDENPTFFQNHIRRFRWINSLQTMDRLLKEPGALLITGELGDQLFGSDMLLPGAQIHGDGMIHENYQDAFAKMLKAWSPPDAGSAEALAERFYPINQECPFPVRSLHDFVWWFNFTQKWSHVKYRFYEMTTADLRLRYGQHIIHFYDSPEFQRWSMDNHDLKIKKTMNSYKWTAKEYIHRFTKDPRQLELIKIQSLEKMYFLDEKRIAIGEDLRVIQSNEELLTYATI